MMFKKPIYWRSQEYLYDYIDYMPCEVKGCNKVVTHHHENLGMGGTALKAPDSHCIAMCVEDHHPEVHRGDKTFYKKYGIDVEAVIIRNITDFIDLKDLDIPEYSHCGTKREAIKLLTEYLHEKGI